MNRSDSALVCASGLSAGLTLGLMGLDKIGLDIIVASEDAKSAKYAKRIIPVRASGNLLLCTLLLINVALNALISILLASLTSGLVGFFISTIVITVFGEMLPQGVCSRHGEPNTDTCTYFLLHCITCSLHGHLRPVACTFDDGAVSCSVADRVSNCASGESVDGPTLSHLQAFRVGFRQNAG